MNTIKQGKVVPRVNEVFLDTGEYGVLKVGGRLGNSTSTCAFKHPMIIPKGHSITNMIIADYHEKVKHQGKGLSMNEIRSNGFWIPGMNRVVTSCTHQCVIYRKHRRPVEEQRMADLPSERVDPYPPFSYCGIDGFGPYHVKQARNTYERFGLPFTCFSSRAVHIEMMKDKDLHMNEWRPGRLLESIANQDGLVRKVKIQLGDRNLNHKGELICKPSVVERPIQKLVLLMET